MMISRRQFLQGLTALVGAAVLPESVLAKHDVGFFADSTKLESNDQRPECVALNVDGKWYPVKEANLCIVTSFEDPFTIEMNFVCNSGTMDLYQKSIYDMAPVEMFVPDFGTIVFDRSMLDLYELLLTSKDMEFSGRITASAVTFMVNSDDIR